MSAPARAGWVVLCLLGFGAAGSASAEGETREAAWSPAASFSFGVINQSISGNAATTEVSFPRAGGDSFISEYFQFEGKLYTPLQLSGFPTKPRVFLTAGLQIPLADELIAERIDEELINRYEPGANTPGNPLLLAADDSAFVRQEFLDNCLQNSAQPGIPLTNPFSRLESCALRVRSKVTVDALWMAGVGVELSIPVFGNVLRIRPAVEYFGMSIQTDGEFVRTNSGATLDDVEEAAKATGDPQLYHGIAPSIAVAVDVFEEGPWRWSMFLQSRIVYFFNEPTLSAQGAISSTNNISFISGVDNLAFQVGGGFQVQWTGLK